ncbi:MAG: O-phosphoseryl-tRNA(Sec) selenium transferase [Candidatus Thorarchaeota archaeon]|nr:MAG: O-phosphoseryl-tRNA(Sec) selenium transferase [Candidatus Thorarchaeota archaeon]
MERDEIDRILNRMIPESMMRHGRATIDASLAPLRDLLNRRQIPIISWQDSQIEFLLAVLSAMDSDKDPKAARVGEREARIATPLLNRLTGGFNHGVGRSGQLSAPQPKATGASIMQEIVDSVALDAIRKLGLPNVRDGIVVPLPTGMSIGLILGGMRRELGIQTVLYPRIDHRSPSRGISLAGLREVSVRTVLDGDAVRMDMEDLSDKMADCKNCVLLGTTTFFPPREADPVKEMARMASDHDIPFIINNAYGVQSAEVMALVRSAIDAGRVDAIVQSSDKNFLTPVGGAVIVSPNEEVIKQTSETYAGRASASPVVQLLVALLALGIERYEALRSQQLDNRKVLESRLREIAEEVGQRVLEVRNPVSVAMTLENLDATEVGSRLYNNRVTGPRSVEKGGFGSCIDGYPHSYIVMNAAIGSSRSDIDKATTKLYKEVRV